MSELAGKAEFARQLGELGYEVHDAGGDRLAFAYAVPCGRYRGQKLEMGFEVPAEFPRTPPHGPHFSPALLPVNTGTDRHPDRVHQSGFGSEWIHWSRPHPAWESTDRSVAVYLAYIKALFCTIAEEAA